MHSWDSLTLHVNTFTFDTRLPKYVLQMLQWIKLLSKDLRWSQSCNSVIQVPTFPHTGAPTWESPSWLLFFTSATGLLKHTVVTMLVPARVSMLLSKCFIPQEQFIEDLSGYSVRKINQLQFRGVVVHWDVTWVVKCHDQLSLIASHTFLRCLPIS